MEFDPSKITKAREEADLSPERLGNSLPSPVSGGTIRNYESGITAPDIHTLIHIAETLGRHILFFLPGDLTKFNQSLVASHSAPKPVPAVAGATNVTLNEG